MFTASSPSMIAGKPDLFEDVPIGSPTRAPIAKAVEDFESLVREIEVDEDLSPIDALREARRRHPDAFEAFQAA